MVYELWGRKRHLGGGGWLKKSEYHHMKGRDVKITQKNRHMIFGRSLTRARALGGPETDKPKHILQNLLSSRKMFSQYAIIM